MRPLVDGEVVYVDRLSRLIVYKFMRGMCEDRLFTWPPLSEHPPNSKSSCISSRSLIALSMLSAPSKPIVHVQVVHDSLGGKRIIPLMIQGVLFDCHDCDKRRSLNAKCEPRRPIIFEWLLRVFPPHKLIHITLMLRNEYCFVHLADVCCQSNSLTFKV